MSSVVFVIGSGGVGKTTISGALATRAADAGIRTLVVTVDPARRLAQALGLASLRNDPIGVGPHLDAAMLDAAASWEALVHRHTDEATADRLVASRFFRAIADRFPGGQAYAVAEETATLHDSGAYELIVVDTPPVGGGMDFFDAPQRIRDLVAGKALRILTGPPLPGRRLVFRLTARPALRLADRVLGGPLLEDLATFLMDLRTTYDGIRRRAKEVDRLIGGSPSVVVTTPDPRPAAEAGRLVAGLGPAVRGVVVNRVVPSRWIGGGDPAGDPHAVCLHTWAAEAERHRRVTESLSSPARLVATVPWLAESPTTLDDLRHLALDAGLERLLR